MGRKVGGLYINRRKFGTLSKPCIKEMMVPLNCLDTNGNNDDKCVKYKDLLRTCTDTHAGIGRKPWGSINYHLHRLSRAKK
ncbi:hypothetical protein MKX01_007236 [Papaver californicum]|nr:hypothetical protein MKX01_007236 [Papaver californicum]